MLSAILGRGHGENGKVIVYTKSGSDWSNPNVQELRATDGADGDYFGADVAISGDFLLVGASQRDQLNGDGSVAAVRRGKAYVFVKDNLGIWKEEDILYNPWAYDQLQFGASVALDGSTAMIGHDNFWGYVTVFNRNFGDWKWQETISAPSDSWDSWSFGKSVDVYGNLALVGGQSGEVTLLKRNRFGLWKVLDVLRNIGWNHAAHLGRNVALGSDIVLVGTDNGQYEEGSVQVFDTYSPIFVSIPVLPHLIIITSEGWSSKLHTLHVLLSCAISLVQKQLDPCIISLTPAHMVINWELLSLLDGVERLNTKSYKRTAHQ